MTAGTSVHEGAAALRAGRWRDAHAAFTAALQNAALVGAAPVGPAIDNTAADNTAADDASLDDASLDDVALEHAAPDTEPSGKALDGLADALWWLGDAHGAAAHRERAYRSYRRAEQPLAATVVAFKLCLDYKSSLGNEVAAAGWIAVAERLLTGSELGPVHGYVWVARAYQTPDRELALELTNKALDLGRALADRDLELLAQGELGHALVATGEIEQGLRLLDETMAAALGGECRRLAGVVYASCAMLNACELAADYARAAQWCRAAKTFVDTYGCPFLYAECRMLYGSVALTVGDWDVAEAELTQAIAIAAAGYPPLASRTRARLALLRARQGRLADADAVLGQVDDPLALAEPAAVLALERGEVAHAAAVLRRFAERAGKQQAHFAPALELAVQALVMLGELDAAGEAAERLADAVAQISATRPRAHAALAEGHLARARGEPERAVACFERAAAQFTAAGLAFDAARAGLELARGLAARGDLSAIGEARGALAAFTRIGAVPLRDAAAALLRSLGVAGFDAPRSSGPLTRREREVLQLLGEGLTNPEIAERLFISRKTAAHHVSHVLAKLGVRNRAEAIAYWARSAGASAEA